MASAANVASSVPFPRAGYNLSMPSFILSIGSCLPITPVEAVRTSSSLTPATLATSLAISLQYSSPLVPVQAFAIPLLTTTALIPSDSVMTFYPI